MKPRQKHLHTLVKMIQRKITIINVRHSLNENLNDKLRWFGNALGLFGERDKDKSCFRIFITLIKAKKFHKGLSSDDIAEQLQLTRGTVVHHLNNMIERGIIITNNRKYELRADNLQDLVEFLKQDAVNTFNNLTSSANELDRVLGLQKY